MVRETLDLRRLNCINLALECVSYSAPLHLELGDFEFDVCAIHGGLVRFCDSYGHATVWKLPTQVPHNAPGCWHLHKTRSLLPSEPPSPFWIRRSQSIPARHWHGHGKNRLSWSHSPISFLHPTPTAACIVAPKSVTTVRSAVKPSATTSSNGLIGLKGTPLQDRAFQTGLRSCAHRGPFSPRSTAVSRDLPTHSQHKYCSVAFLPMH